MAKRVFAILGIVVLVGMYALTLFFGITDNPNTLNLLGASVAATIVIPVVLWVGMLYIKGRETNKKKREDSNE